MSKEEKICANHLLETGANMPKQEKFCANLWPETGKALVTGANMTKQDKFCANHWLETGANMTNQEKFCACCFPKALDRPPGSALDSQALYTNMLLQGGLKHREINMITGMLFQDGSLAQARGDLPMVKFGPLAGEVVEAVKCFIKTAQKTK